MRIFDFFFNSWRSGLLGARERKTVSLSFLLLWASILSIGFADASDTKSVRRHSCAELFKPRPSGALGFDFSRTTSHMFMVLDLGPHSKIVEVRKQDGVARSFMRSMIPNHAQTPPNNFRNWEISSNADPKDRVYFAHLQTDNGNLSEIAANLYSVHDPSLSRSLVDKRLEKVWETYEQKQTAAELQDLIRLEALLPLERKILITLEAKDGTILSVMRVFDGTPAPAFYLGDRMRDDIMFRKTTPLLPVEQRFRSLNLRKTSDYIFEIGRLAGDSSFRLSLPFQFRNLAGYLAAKFGYLRQVPREYLDGLVYIEVTTERLRYAMEDLGFDLMAIKDKEGRVKAFDKSVTFAELRLPKEYLNDKDSRFLLKMLVTEFVGSFQ